MRKHLQTLKVFVSKRSLFSNRLISIISAVQRETTLATSDSTDETVSMEPGIVRVVSFSKTEISERTRLKIRSPGSGYHNEALRM